MRVLFGSLLIVLGVLVALPGLDLIYQAWNLPAHAPSPVSVAGITLGHREACSLFLIPAAILVGLGVVVVMNVGRPD